MLRHVYLNYRTMHTIIVAVFSNSVAAAAAAVSCVCRWCKVGTSTTATTVDYDFYY